MIMGNKWAICCGIVIFVLSAATQVRTRLINAGVPNSFNNTDTSLVILGPQDVDFGLVTPNTARRLKVQFQNRGEKRLIVREKDPCESCNTTASDPNAFRYLAIPPRHTRSLELSFIAPEQPGSIVKRREFVTNDPLLPCFSISIRATVNQGVSSGP